jgi:hypothetical protein
MVSPSFQSKASCYNSNGHEQRRCVALCSWVVLLVRQNLMSGKCAIDPTAVKLCFGVLCKCVVLVYLARQAIPAVLMLACYAHCNTRSLLRLARGLILLVADISSSLPPAIPLPLFLC